MPAVADITRSRRQRAGSRRNKRLKNVGSFGSDSLPNGSIDYQTTYSQVENHSPRSVAPEDMHTTLHRAIQRMTLRSLRQARRGR